MDHVYRELQEGLGALAIAGFILFTAFEILRTAIERIVAILRNQKPAAFVPIPVKTN